MYARWISFAIGLGLLLAPLALGYPSVATILQDVAAGLLVCITTLAALEWPPARFLLGLPALWLVFSGGRAPEPAVAAVELAAGALLAVLALVPSARHLPRLEDAGRGRAGARA